MGVEHITREMRTGRPRGSKSAPSWVRDVRWAYRNLGRPEAEPPSELAKLLVSMGREQPERFLACLAALESLAPKAEEPRVNGAQVNGAGRPANGVQVDGWPQRVMTVPVPWDVLLSRLMRYRASVPSDCEVVACAVDRARGGVVFTIKSDTFRPVAAGEWIPELQPKYG
jgi:hypothetical protein